MRGCRSEARLLDEAVSATKRAGELTLQLLTFAKGGDPVRTAVHLDEVIREAATFAHRGSGVKSEFDMPGDLWAANVDKAQISQVIQNLVINATQAMPDGGTLRIAASNERIAAGAHPPLAEGDYIRITAGGHRQGHPAGAHRQDLRPVLHDEAAGPRPRAGDRLLDRQEAPGAHRGELRASGGARRSPSGSRRRPSPQPAPARGAPAPGVVRGKRVLFMDDEEPILKMAEKLMRRLGLEFESAADGREAVERYRAAKESGKPFDLVVMDLTIPGGMGGKEAISLLREIDPGVRAIVSSGYSSDLAMADFRKHGFRGMVAKPYDISELASVVRTVLGEAGPA